MSKDSQALLMLAGVMVLALAGVATLVGGATRRAELVLRGGDSADERNARRLAEDLDMRLRSTELGGRLQQWLQGAGIALSPVDFLTVVAMLTVVATLISMLFLTPLVSLIIGGGLAIGAARIYVEREREARREAFIGQLAELARTLSNGAAAGLSMAGAVQLAARELPDPAGAEMRSVVTEMRLGRSLEDALERLRDRLPSREVAVLMSTIAIQQRAGGDTVRALGELSDTLEARKDVRREIRTVLSGTVFTSYLVAAMGIGTILLMNVMSPGVLREVTGSLLGIAALVVAGTLWTIAFVLIRKTTRIEV